MYADRLLLMTQQTITNRSTRFTYSDLVLSQSSIGPCDSFTATVTVTNAGSRDGDEVVQAYVKTPHATVPAPRVRLADFARVHVAKGQSTKVTLTIAPKYHCVVKNEGRDGFWSPKLQVEQGELSVHVGGGQPDFAAKAGAVLSATATVTAEGTLNSHYRCAS